MQPRYRIVHLQGNEAVKTDLLYYNEAKQVFLSVIGQYNLTIEKDDKILSFEEACKELDLEEEIVNQIVKLRMHIDSLYAKCK